jgi:hypothetical protein
MPSSDISMSWNMGEMLDMRSDDLESAKVKLISGDEVKARLKAKSASRTDVQI